MRVSARWVTSYDFACRSAACRPPTSGGTGGSLPGTLARVSVIRGDIQRERKAILKELDAQGIDPMNPLRHIFESPMGNRIVVIRDANGYVRGGVQINVSKSSRKISVVDMRMLDQKKGDGTEAFRVIGKMAHEAGYALAIYGALNSAKPFYAKQGAIFQKPGSNTGGFTKRAIKALAEGKPMQGGEFPYDDWVKYDLT